MKTYTTKDGEAFKAVDADDLVKQMAMASFGEAANVKAYMKEYAERVEMVTGQSIRSGNAIDFVHDLIGLGEVT